MTNLPTADDVRRRLAALETRLAAQSRNEVSIVAVTKAFPAELLRVAADAGCAAIGENYAQELLAKVPALDGLVTRPEVHFIGRLQSNKVQIARRRRRRVGQPRPAARSSTRSPGASRAHAC